MPDPDKPEKPKAIDVLRGQKPTEKPPARMVRQGVHLTPSGTETRLEHTPEARAYLARLAEAHTAEQRKTAGMRDAPRVPRKALDTGQELSSQPDRLHGIFNQHVKNKDRGNDFER